MSREAAHAERCTDCAETWPHTPLMRSHEWIDQRSLALHEAVAATLEGDPTLLDVARANLQRWLRTTPRPRCS